MAMLVPSVLCLGSWHQAGLPVSARTAIAFSGSPFDIDNSLLGGKNPSKQALKIRLNIETSAQS